ncbi:MAG: TonB-dependent receptor, partial [Opitutaceae bacterium]
GTLVFNTGLLRETFALTVGLVSKKGGGYVRGAWSEGRGYYIGSTLVLNPKNRIELFVIGAPMRHGQRTFASNIAAYDADYARKLGYDGGQIEAALARGPIDAGDDYNPNYAPVSPSYAGKVYYWDGIHNREEAGFINERENYFHKPQANINWYSDISDRLRLASVFYYSGGRGGGTGTLNNGSSSAAFGRIPNTDPLYGSNIDWDATVASNMGGVNVRGDAKTPGQSLGILRNSVNNQDQFGAISKLTYDAYDSLTFTSGVDWRTAEIHHFREVRDLLGGDYYLPASSQISDFAPGGVNTPLGLGDKVDYYNTNEVDWLGLFLTSQYKNGPVTAFAVYGYSTIDYSYVDHFRDDGAGREYSLDVDGLDGHQIKGGVSYAFNDQISAFVNAGWVSKAPIFDGAIDDVTGTIIDPTNEKFTSFEAGVRYQTPDGKLNVSSSLYHTLWRDRTITEVDEQGEDTIVIYQRGVNSNYSGIEIEATYQPARMLRFDAAASFGDWYFTDDASFDAVNVTTGEPAAAGNSLFLRDLKVGDAPQSQIAYAVSVFPIDGLSVKLQGRWYDHYWSDYEPNTRTDGSDRGQSWRIPSYTVYDLHTSYQPPFGNDNIRTSVFVHVFNLFDKTYVSDATDNSEFEGIPDAPSHSAQRAEVFLGPPLTFNAGFKIQF